MLRKFDVFYFVFSNELFLLLGASAFLSFFLLILDEGFVMTPCICLTNEIKIVTKTQTKPHLI